MSGAGDMSATADTSGARALLEVSDLRSGYGRVPVLHGIDFQVGEGEILGVLGHNGMGKTTLLKTLMGIVRRLGRRGDLCGHRPDARAHERALSAWAGLCSPGARDLPQPHRLRQSAHGCRRPRTSTRTRHCATSWPSSRGLSVCSTARAVPCQGGEQQLLALARCLISEPELILLDEPTEGIQPSIIDEIIELLEGAERPARGRDRAGRAKPRLCHLAVSTGCCCCRRARSSARCRGQRPQALP